MNALRQLIRASVSFGHRCHWLDLCLITTLAEAWLDPHLKNQFLQKFLRKKAVAKKSARSGKAVLVVVAVINAQLFIGTISSFFSSSTIILFCFLSAPIVLLTVERVAPMISPSLA